MACNVHIDYVPRTTVGVVAAELLVSSMRLLPEALFLTETRAGMQTAIFAKEAFLQLCGYSMVEVLDHDPRFLQGTDTDPSSFVQFFQPLQREQISEHEMMLYKKDGTPFVDQRSDHHFLFMSGYSHDSRVHDPKAAISSGGRFQQGALMARTGELLQETTSV